jgi:DNA-binding transcriptional MerR regulator
MTARTISIKEAAAETKLSSHTLRYYERIGLLSIARDANGQRRYNEGDLRAIAILLRLRATGMPIQVMQRFAALLRLGDASIPERRALLEAHQQTVRANISELETNLEAIATKIGIYKNVESQQSVKSRPSSRARRGARAKTVEV